MNEKGITLIELLIVIVVIGIISAFTVVTVDIIINNVREDGFVANADTFVDAARSAHNVNHSLFDDNIATLRELIDNDFVDRAINDPWGGEYDLDETYITRSYVSTSTGLTKLSTTVIFSVRAVSTNATLGYDVPLEDYTRDDLVLLNGNTSILDTVFQVFDSTSNEDITGSDAPDDIDVGGNFVKSSVDTGAGDDTIDVGGNIRKSSTVDTGDGNDTVTATKSLESSINTGSGDDTVNMTKVFRGSTLETEDGNDSVYLGFINRVLDIDLGSGEDTLTVKQFGKYVSGSITLGDGNDTFTSTERASDITRNSIVINGGSGTDTLNLTKITIQQWNDGVKDNFTGFETIVLKDGTVSSLQSNI